MSRSANFLQGLTVVDLGLGMAPALITKFMREAGARVHRFEPPGGDPFYAIYPAYGIWHHGKSARNLDATAEGELQETLANADIVVIGGEAFPQLDWAFDAQDIAARNPCAVVLELTASVATEAEKDAIANELLMQARTGMCFEHYSDRPVNFAYPVASYGAVLSSLIAVITALIAREDSGQGQIISESLMQGCLESLRVMWLQAERPDARFRGAVPKDSRMTIFKCADGKYVHMMLGLPGSKKRFHDLLGIDPNEIEDYLNENGSATGMGKDPGKFWGDVDAYAVPIAKWTSEEFKQKLREIDIPSATVTPPGEAWELPQVALNEILETDPEGNQYVGFPIRGL